ncbi:NAD(P)H-hydrate dehydratase [Kovacikia minuta CCNUW1]|uniref:NAD(P)H-hydrate dehydratase n=1 Tax=Kovacikia minuta TaxID=2931930 RepID=UPI001CCA27A9|nr:NAD(P)H-hydrate dehydratase [Kovacikia minuta]UBF28790.1 NAD(P)H-hydrate dehydratase [Kovacikia minuta CCNUW1]
MTCRKRSQDIQQFVVTAVQMRQIEERVFAAGMPVAALMEKVAGLVARRVEELYPVAAWGRVGVLVGPGHNGGDALVVARELYFRGYEAVIYCPFSRLKELTESHHRYCAALGIPIVGDTEALRSCDFLIDGLFGFGLERSLTEPISTAIHQINEGSQPVVSIDLPSGLHTDTGAVMGTAVRATHSLCLGLWKLGLLQDDALEYVGKAELIDFDLPLTDIQAVLGTLPRIQRTTSERAIAHLPLNRPPTTHKYKMGHLLLICGSRRYAGGAVLTGLGARASGVGMLSIAVPDSLKPILTAQLPEALVLGCPETEAGAIAHLPDELDWAAYHTIACGPGLTKEARAIVQQVLGSQRSLVLDADGLNILAELGTVSTLQARQAATVLTPHLGEFRRLFPDLAEEMSCRVTATRAAAAQTGAVVLLKGARIAIADASGATRINPESTPALARGGSGDVLTGLMGGLLAQAEASPGHSSLIDVVQSAAWWHAQAGILAAEERSELGVDAFTLSQYLIPAVQKGVGKG